MKTFTRGEVTPSALSEALDEMGVASGERFFVAALAQEPGAPAHPRARSTDPGTSRRAWLENLPRAGTQRAKVLDAIADSDPGLYAEGSDPGLTAEETAAATGLPYVSVSTRISELKAGHWIEPHGTRPTAHGAEADVLVLTALGRERRAEMAVAA